MKLVALTLLHGQVPFKVKPVSPFSATERGKMTGLDLTT